MRRQRIILHRYKLERDWGRVGDGADRLWVHLLAGATCIALAALTSGIFLYVLPIVMGLVRNRPMQSILVWTVLFGWTGIGWIVGLVKACSNH